MPSSQHFFHDIFHYEYKDPDKEMFINMLGLTFEFTHDFVVRAWGGDKNFSINEWKNVDVEEVFTFLDVGERMFNKGTNYHLAFAKAKEYLEKFIIIALGMRCRRQYCKHHWEVLGSLKPDDSIISFNWDTIADETLARLGITQYKNYLAIMAEDKIHLRKYYDKGLFLKLHGSLNWVTCQNKSCKDYGKPRIPLKKNGELPLLVSSDFDRCPICKGKEIKTFIIPPVSNKFIDKDSFMRKLWMIAEDKILRAKRIIFVGYSFPRTDFYTEWLFRQIHFLTGNKPDIIVVNPEMYKRGSQVKKRYKTIFKNCKITTYKTLSEFANSCVEFD